MDWTRWLFSSPWHGSMNVYGTRLSQRRTESKIGRASRGFSGVSRTFLEGRNSFLWLSITTPLQLYQNYPSSLLYCMLHLSGSLNTNISFKSSKKRYFLNRVENRCCLSRSSIDIQSIIDILVDNDLRIFKTVTADRDLSEKFFRCSISARRGMTYSARATATKDCVMSHFACRLTRKYFHDRRQVLIARPLSPPSFIIVIKSFIFINHGWSMKNGTV